MKWNSSRIIQLRLQLGDHHEGISLAEGRKLFGDRAVLGGFVNGKKACSTRGTSNYRARNPSLGGRSWKSRFDPWSELHRAGRFQLERLDWVRQAAVL